MLRILLAGAGLLVLAGAGAGVGFYLAFVRDLPELESLADYRPPLATRVLDRKGRLIGEFYRERRRLTPLEEVPDHVIRAFVAGEDSTFFEHAGIDYMSILRAAWKNFLAGGEIKQGGSTITQQMVKTLLLSPERSYRRKIREMVLARDIERRFSKQDILYLYLNQIYFGHGAHGIGEAARTYFDKPVSELSISEGAMLAGLPKAPSRYSPHANPRQAEERRLYVLERMHADDFLDDATYQAAVEDVPVVAEPESREDFEATAYFTEEVRRRLFDELGGDTVLEGGLVVETTLDLDLQRAAVEAVREGLVALSRRQGYRGPLRRVARSEIAAEIEKLAVENGLAAEEPPQAAAEGEETGEEGEQEPASEPRPPLVAEAAPVAEPPSPPHLEGDGPFLGVVTAVDRKAKQATVAFGADVQGIAHLADVSWAREPNPSQAPRRVRKIEKVFQVGDVLPFERLPASDEEAADEGGDTALRVAIHQEPLVEGALLSIDIEADEVLSLVGGYDYARSQFDRVTQARRQPGSSFKPFIYGAALAKGYTAASIIYDRPVVYTDEASGFVWRPRNYGRSFYGPITLREALSRSVNNATVHLFRDVGVDYVMSYARRLGIESPLNRDLSLALGSSSVSLLELTRAYATFPAGGRAVEPVFIRKVTDRDGGTLLAHVPLANSVDDAQAVDEEDDSEAELADVAASFDTEAEAGAGAGAGDGRNGKQLISPEQAYLVTDLLRAVVVDPDGTGWRLRALKRPVAGKTGTTNDQGDAWFMGFSPEIATGVWVGHDESRFLGWGETGSRAAAPIWVAYMKVALAERPVRDFQVPDDIVFARIDRKTGLLASTSSKETVFQAFLVDTVPTETSESERTEIEGRRLLRLDTF